MRKELINILNICSDNAALKFIVWRFKLDKYRGIQIFQHNRYDEKKMCDIIEIIKEATFRIDKQNPKDVFIEIPRGDENSGKNNGFLLAQYKEYGQIIKKMQDSKLGGTANSLKKNYFPDWERANIITRYSKLNKTYFKLNDRFLTSSREEWIKNKEYLLLVTCLMGDLLNSLVSLLKVLEKIKYYEFLLFFTFINVIKDEKEINNEEACEHVQKLIESWRQLTILQQENVISNLQAYMNPLMYKKVTKDKKKDWRNFNNESTQILKNLNQSNLFKVDTKNTICWKTEGNSKFLRDKTLYEEYHKINETTPLLGYEMDHIVRFSLITKPEHLVWIESPYNLLYMDATQHAIKSQQKNKHMIFAIIDENTIELKSTDYSKQSIILNINKNVFIKKENLIKYKNHNNKTFENVLNVILECK